MTKQRARTLLSLLLLLAGCAVLLYPVAATLIANYSQEQVAVATRNLVQKDYPDAKLEEMMEQARVYNEQLHTGPILDPFLQRVAPDTKLYRDYLKILDFDGVIGTINIPKIHTKLPIYHGTDDATLARGAGHLFGTAMPIGGKRTHTVITAHSGLSDATMFDDLPKLQKGDSFYVTVGKQTIRYKVISKEVVTPTTTDSLYPQEGKDLATLITCTPYGVNSHRLLVHAERAPMDIDPTTLDKVDMRNVIRWWMGLPILAIVLVLFLVIWGHRRRKKKARAAAAAAVGSPESASPELPTPEARLGTKASADPGSGPVTSPESPAPKHRRSHRRDRKSRGKH